LVSNPGKRASFPSFLSPFLSSDAAIVVKGGHGKKQAGSNHWGRQYLHQAESHLGGHILEKVMGRKIRLIVVQKQS